MIGQLALIVAGSALLAIGYGLVVRRSYRRGVGIIARQMDGRIYFLSTQVLDDEMFMPGADDDRARLTCAFGNWSVTGELLRRHSFAVRSPAAHVKLTGL